MTIRILREKSYHLIASLGSDPIQAGLTDRIHSILSVETTRAAVIIRNELLILGDWAFGH
jgi:hypothetical protein